MSKSSNKKITIANMISVFGLVIMTFLFFCGNALQNYSNNFGLNIILAVAILLSTSLLLWLLVYAKNANNDFGKWRIVEVLTLLLFVCLAYFSSTKIMHFFVVNDNLEEYKITAMDDVSKISKEIERFRAQEIDRLVTHCEGYRNAEEIYSHIDLSNIEKIEGHVYDKWVSKINDINDADGNYGPNWETQLDELKSVVEDWNFITLPGAVNQLEVLAHEVSEKLTKISGCYEFYIIENGKPELSNANVYEVKPEFPSIIAKLSGFSILGIIIIVVIYVLILSNYIFAYRSHKVPPTKKSHFEGGAPLN